MNAFVYPASRDLSYRHEKRNVLRGDMRDLCSQNSFCLEMCVKFEPKYLVKLKLTLDTEGRQLI